MKERGNGFLRWVDRRVGIPLVMSLSLFKKKRSFPQQIKQIAFLKTAGIGDLVILSAIIRDVQETYPEVRITLFTGQSNREMGELIPGVKVVALPITNPFKALRIIRGHSFDLWLDCDPWPRINALFSFFAKTSFTIGFKTANQWRHFLYDRPVQHSFECHELENYQKLLDLKKRSFPSIPLKARKVQKRICLHRNPGGSRAELKKWPEKNWKTLTQIMIKEGFELILTGGKGEETMDHPDVLDFSGKLTLQETASLLKTCGCIVSVDTGIMHLAAALGCPVVSLHGPTSPERWGALGDKVLAVTPKIDYKSCIQLGFESGCRRNRCMEAISVEQVKEAVFTIGDWDESYRPRRGERNTPVASLSKPLS